MSMPFHNLFQIILPCLFWRDFLFCPLWRGLPAAICFLLVVQQFTRLRLVRGSGSLLRPCMLIFAGFICPARPVRVAMCLVALFEVKSIVLNKFMIVKRFHKYFYVILQDIHYVTILLSFVTIHVDTRRGIWCGIQRRNKLENYP